MNIFFESHSIFAKLKVKDNNTVITEDVADFKGKIPEYTIDAFVNIANQMYKHNDGTDVDFVWNVFSKFLNANEQQRFIDEYLTK